MAIQNKVLEVFEKALSGDFIRNVGWLASAEFVSRVFRLATTVTLARSLSTSDYGVLAIIFTTIEFANVLTMRGGIGGKIIQASEQELQEITNTVYYLNWIIFASVFSLQCLLAFPIARFYDNSQVILPICIISISYLIMPIFLVHGSLIQRNNQMKVIATANVLSNLSGSILTIGLALSGFGIWSVVLSFVATQFVWLFTYLQYKKWRPTQSFTLHRWKEIILFAKNIVGVELLDKLRSNADYLLVGRFWGTEALGLYYFAFNAGLGISMNIIGVFWYTVLPHLCSARGDTKVLASKYRESIKSMYSIMLPLILLQVSLAPIYVPLVFGQKWVGAVPILMIVCLSALPRPLGMAASQLLVSVDKGRLDLYWSTVFTFVFLLSLLIAAQWSILAVAVSVLAVHIVFVPIFVYWATKNVFGNKSALTL